MSGWQPIETAPKDGTRVILLDDCGLAVIAEWEDDLLGYPWKEDGQRAKAEIFTHWMAIPPPPTTSNLVEDDLPT